MTKEEARENLEQYFWEKFQIDDRIKLPIVDEKVITIVSDGTIEQWTFMGLIKIAYDLR